VKAEWGADVCYRDGFQGSLSLEKGGVGYTNII
jgi:hypothetical protein